MATVHAGSRPASLSHDTKLERQSEVRTDALTALSPAPIADLSQQEEEEDVNAASDAEAATHDSVEELVEDEGSSSALAGPPSQQEAGEPVTDEDSEESTAEDTDESSEDDSDADEPDEMIPEVVNSLSRSRENDESLPTDSMISVSLSEHGNGDLTVHDMGADTLTADINVEPSSEDDAAPEKPQISVDTGAKSSRPSSIVLLGSAGPAVEGQESGQQETNDAAAQEEMSRAKHDSAVSSAEDGNEDDELSDTASIRPTKSPVSSRPNSAEIFAMRDEHEDVDPVDRTLSRSTSGHSSGSEQVNWEQLDKTEEEEQEQNGNDSGDSTALLLARLEQENNALATDPKSNVRGRQRSGSRPPSMQFIRRLAKDNRRSGLHFSKLPSPPPMTELEFWTALARDYPQTATRLPTLTSNKVRGGVPAPLRGVVWLSMAGARDQELESQFDKLVEMSSPYENMIGKDIGRSFPGVEMFRDPEGEGQQMLARVLKCFSLYDEKIGYCQGLGFLVGPLLMQMGDKEAFCVLVRLMEDYDLRACFLPDLSGLHLRIYQFQQLLTQHSPELAAHLESLQVEAAYLSQWFLSFFAVTCPLPMLFRIYDVIFAEGASATIMRVALSIMRRNEKKLMAFTEFEDVMQLLLGRALWDPYGLNAKSADELVNDFVSFTSLVTGDVLKDLEVKFRETQKDDGQSSKSLEPEVQSAAARFLGRLWAPAAPKTTLSPPNSASPRPNSFLRRTPSKQSLASTLNSIEGGSDGTSTNSTAMTDYTANYRESTAETLSLKSQHDSLRQTPSNKDKDLHSQIEDLLTAMNEMQREQALLAAELQKEREDRTEDHRAIRALVTKLKQDNLFPTNRDDRRKTISQLPASPISPTSQRSGEMYSDDLVKLVSDLNTRLNQGHSRTPSAARASNNRMSIFETKQTLRESLSRARDLYTSETSRTADLQRRCDELEKDVATAKEQAGASEDKMKEKDKEMQTLANELEELRQNAANWEEEATPTEEVAPEFPDPPRGLSIEAPILEVDEDKTPRLPSSEEQPAIAIQSEKTTHETPRDSTTSHDSLDPSRSASITSVASMAEPPTPQKQSHNRNLSVITSPSPAKPTSHSRTHSRAHSRNLSATSITARTSSLTAQPVLATPRNKPVSEDALLLELVNAKTAEAVARQELEELKSKFDALRRVLSAPMHSALPPPTASSPYAVIGSSNEAPSHSPTHAPSASTTSLAAPSAAISASLSSSAAAHRPTPSEPALSWLRKASAVGQATSPPAAANSNANADDSWIKRSGPQATGGSSSAENSQKEKDEEKDKVETPTSASASASSSSGGGGIASFWGWGKRSTSAAAS